MPRRSRQGASDARRKATRPLPPPRPLLIGAEIGGLPIRAIVGTSAFGIVYRVHDAALGRDLAVKEFFPGALVERDADGRTVRLREPEAQDAFEAGLRFFANEARLLRTLEHPGLVKAHQDWQENGTRYMAMDFVPGRTIHETVLSRWRSPREATVREMLRTLLGALHVIHKTGLQHRNISPQTVMLTPTNQPVLLDLAAPRRVMSSRGESGPMGPREGFAPIEVYAEGNALKRGPWTDFYALGATLLYLMTTRVLPGARERRADESLAGSLQREHERYSLELLAILEWMCAREPADRPQSVAELRDALDGKGLPERHAPSRGDHARVWLRRYRIWIATVAAVAMVAVTGVGLKRAYDTGRLPYFKPPVEE